MLHSGSKKIHIAMNQSRPLAPQSLWTDFGRSSKGGEAVQSFTSYIRLLRKKFVSLSSNSLPSYFLNWIKLVRRRDQYLDMNFIDADNGHAGEEYIPNNQQLLVG